MRHLPLIFWLSCSVHAATVELSDDTGRTVTLIQPAQRIITLAPHATELVFAAGAGNRLVAVAAYSDYPEQAQRLPRIGGAGGVDRERLLTYRADLVVAWHSGSRRSDLDWLDRIGIPVYRSEPKSLSDIAKNLRNIGILTGNADIANRAAHAYEDALARACPQREYRRSAFYQLWEQPLLTYGGAHWVNDALNRLSLRNVFHDVDRAVFSPTEEAVLTMNADILLASATNKIDRASTSRIIRTPSTWDRPTPQTPAVLKELCKALEEL